MLTEQTTATQNLGHCWRYGISIPYSAGLLFIINERSEEGKQSQDNENTRA